MLWKETARVYLSTREKAAGMAPAAFEEFRQRWEVRAVAGMTEEQDPMQRAKWVGFVDALNDAILLRAGRQDEDGDLARLLDYLYEEREK